MDHDPRPARQRHSSRPADIAAPAETAMMAREMQALLGPQMVAYVCGVRSAGAVAAWASDDAGPDPRGLARLLALYRTYTVLRDAGETRATIVAWFTGSNPMLGDEAPVEVLRVGDRDDAVDVAARAFVE